MNQLQTCIIMSPGSVLKLLWWKWGKSTRFYIVSVKNSNFNFLMYVTFYAVLCWSVLQCTGTFFLHKFLVIWPTSKINWFPPQLSWNLLGAVVWGGWRSAMDTIIHMYESWILHDLCSSAPSACLTVHTVNYEDVAAPGDCWWRSPEVIGQNRAVSNSYTVAPLWVTHVLRANKGGQGSKFAVLSGQD